MALVEGELAVGCEAAEEVRIEVIDPSGTVIREFAGRVEREEDEASPDEADEQEEATQDEGRMRGEQPRDANLEEESLDVSAGMNEWSWNLRYSGPEVLASARFSLASTGGAVAPPGRCTLRDTAGQVVREVAVKVGLDPRVPTATEGDMAARHALTR